MIRVNYPADYEKEKKNIKKYSVIKEIRMGSNLELIYLNRKGEK